MRDLHVALIWVFLAICLAATVFPRTFEVMVCRFFGVLGEFAGVLFVLALLFWGLRKIITGK